MSFAVEHAVQNFYRWYAEGIDKGKSYSSLEEALSCWVINRRASDDCSRDFRIFLAAAAFLFAQHADYQRRARKNDPRWPGLWPQKMPALERENEISTEIFDPLYFQTYTDGK